MKKATKPAKFKNSEYSQIREDLDTFDLLLWSGTGRLSKFIQMGTGSTWSHVGMVIRMPGDLLMLWESTLGEDHSGVQLTPLSKSVYGKVAVRRMNVERTADHLERLMEVRKLLDGRPFEKNWLEFFRAGYDGIFGENTRDISTLFCAELVAETLQQVGLLDDSIPSNEFTPKDFSSEAAASLPLLMGASLESEVMLTQTEEVKPMKAPRGVKVTKVIKPNPRLFPAT